jgi:tRNA threonylcarbamoyladenosine biosynthesis protein TsaB
VALVGAGAVLAQRADEAGRQPAEALFPALEALFGATRLALRDIGSIVVLTGPDGFAGPRVGVAAARGLALALGRPAVGVALDAAFAGDPPDLAAVAEAGRRARRAGAGAPRPTYARAPGAAPGPPRPALLD